MRDRGVRDMGNLGKILLLVAFIAYPILLHAFILKEEVEMAHLLFVFAPLLAVAAWVAFRMVGKVWWPLTLRKLENGIRKLMVNLLFTKAYFYAS